MKLKNYFIIFLCTFPFLQTLKIKAQTCPTTNIVAPDWTRIIDINSLDDKAWDIEPIDSDADGIKDDGFVIVGTANTSGLTLRQAVVIRLNPDGSSYTHVGLWGGTGVMTYGGNLNDNGYAIEQASDGNLIVVGTKHSTAKGTPANDNVWIFKLNLSTGAIISGSEHEYGGSGNEVGFDIKDDVANGKYVVVGATGAVADYDLSIFGSINPSSEYWVLQINKATYAKDWQEIYDGIYSGVDTTGDWAHSVLIDHAGYYVVSGFCSSCESDDYTQQALIIKINPVTHNSSWKNDYGDIPDPSLHDQGSYNIIEVYDGTNYSYLSTGITHTPSGGTGCYGNAHDFYGLKLNASGGNLWTGGCHLDEGLNYGGSLKDDGYCAVQTCDGGYLLAGGESSAAGSGNVICHIGNSDHWLVKINSSGGYEWDETLGTAYADELHSIKEVPDGSFVIAGQQGTATLGNPDIYASHFALTCAKPTNLHSTPNGCSAMLSWNSSPCALSYILKYKKSTASSWITINPATSPTNISVPPAQSGTYNWVVQAICSASVSDLSSSTFTLNACKMASGENHNDTESGVISIYPNPSDGLCEISFQSLNDINQQTTIQLLDQVGKSVFFTTANVLNGVLNKKLSVNNLPSGFYYVRMIIDHRTYQSKMIIQ